MGYKSKRPAVVEPTVITESTFRDLDTLLSSWAACRQVQDDLKVKDEEYRRDILPIALAHITVDNHAPFSGVTVQMREDYTYNPDDALAWATDDKNLSGAISMLQVDDVGVMRLVGLLMRVDDPQIAQDIKDCLSIKHTGYVEALREKTHVGMPPFTVESKPVLALSKQNIKTGQALRDSVVVVPDPETEAVSA